MMQRRDGRAVWRQIVEHIALSIRDGELATGARLPSEADLARSFQVNRHTVRRALEDLARGRQIRIEHGRGSFVTEPVLDYRLDRRPRFSEWVRRHNREPSGEALELRERIVSDAPDADLIAEALDIAPGDRVIELERLGCADAVPVLLARHVFPAARLPGLLLSLEAPGSITAALARVGVADYVRKRSRIGARMPSPREASLLKLAPATPVLHCENLNTTPAGVPTELCFVIYPASRVQLVVEPGEDGAPSPGQSE